MEKFFKLSENGTSVKTEVVAGLTTFMTMAYIIALNPNLLTGWRAGGDDLWNAVFLATCLASGIAMICMAFLANKPFCLAPGMGLNSFFAVVVAQVVTITGTSYVASFQAALIIILAEGIVFLILTILNIREKIVEAIPYGVRMGIAPAIGLMLLNIGVGSNAGVFGADGNPFYVMRDFFGATDKIGFHGSFWKWAQADDTKRNVKNAWLTYDKLLGNNDTLNFMVGLSDISRGGKHGISAKDKIVRVMWEHQY